jgi:hypothetical protein
MKHFECFFWLGVCGLIFISEECHIGRKTEAAGRSVKDIRRQIRKRYSSEEKIRIVRAGPRGEDSHLTKAQAADINDHNQRRCRQLGQILRNG